jgi:NADPH:quinone reductase
MRAVRFDRLGSIEDGRIEEVPVPAIEADHVLVEVRAISVKYVDLVTIRGRYQFRPELPYTPGKGPAGIVRGIGSDVTKVRVGDRVLGMAEVGGFAEAVAVPADQVHRLPENLDFGGAATMAVAYDTAWMALRDRARLEPGQSVLVLGATGAVGRAAVHLARAMGAGIVLAGLEEPQRLDADPLGDAVDGRVDLGMTILRDSIRDDVRALTSGRGVDIVVDLVGGDAFDGAIRSLAWRGRYVVVGFASGRIATLQSNYVLLKNIEVSGLQISDYRKRMPEMVTAAFREVFNSYEMGAIKVPEYESHPLDYWSTALRAIEGRRAVRPIVLQPNEEKA